MKTKEKVEFKKVFITGCAKSGTTLLRRLFYAFNPYEVQVIDVELEAMKFIKPYVVPSTEEIKVLVAKRWGTDLFTWPLSFTEFEDQLRALKENKVIIINIFRDGRDVIAEDNNWVPIDRWIDCIRQMTEYKKDIDLNIRFEELVKNPEKIREEIEKLLGIETEYNFSEYPIFYHAVDDLDRTGKDIYKPREISKAEVKKFTINYKRKLDKIYPRNEQGVNHFEEALINAGYIT